MRTPALALVAFLCLASPALAAPPVPDYTVSPAPPVACAPVTFTDKSSGGDPGDTIVSVEWDFGDGTDHFTQDPTTQPTVTHTYAAGGEVLVKRIVTDSGGESARDEIPLVVEDNDCPVGTFWPSPESPVVGQSVRFASFASDSDDPELEYAWDVDGDGFDDGSDDALTHVFATEGTHNVRLRLTDDDHAFTIIEKAVAVGPVPPPSDPVIVTQIVPGPTTVVTAPPPTTIVEPAQPSLMSPFPIVRIAGTVLSRGARVRTLEVRTSIGSRITVRCAGRSCPFARANRVAKTRLVRFRGMRGFLRAGAVLSISVRKTGQIGKFTRFVIRAGRVPKRTDLCLMPGRSTPSACP
ncbi:MAG TPA: PKD domain-containing protein, partial [Thermoleophilaceae bacterium]|nr:PKD domain-containing protein [Thermoleophilaceae bacterium]